MHHYFLYDLLWKEKGERAQGWEGERARGARVKGHKGWKKCKGERAQVQKGAVGGHKGRKVQEQAGARVKGQEGARVKGWESARAGGHKVRVKGQKDRRVKGWSSLMTFYLFTFAPYELVKLSLPDIYFK